MKPWLTARADHLGSRSDQQDRAAVFRDRNRHEYLLVVSDGVGGVEGGALASQAVVDVASTLWKSPRRSQMPAQEFLSRLCRKAHAEITRIGKHREVAPRATIAAVLVRKGEAAWAHSGDSRVYHFRQRNLIRRTRDHSVLQILVDRGTVKEEEMGTHPDQGVLLQSLGGEEFKEPTFGSSKVRRGDAFLACTDGFWEYITVREIGKILNSGSRMETLLQRAVGAAANRGGAKADNIAAVAIAGGGQSAFASALTSRHGILGGFAALVVLAVGVLSWSFGGFDFAVPRVSKPAVVDSVEDTEKSNRDLGEVRELSKIKSYTPPGEKPVGKGPDTRKLNPEGFEESTVKNHPPTVTNPEGNPEKQGAQGDTQESQIPAPEGTEQPSDDSATVPKGKNPEESQVNTPPETGRVPPAGSGFHKQQPETRGNDGRENQTHRPGRNSTNGRQRPRKGKGTEDKR